MTFCEAEEEDELGGAEDCAGLCCCCPCEDFSSAKPLEAARDSRGAATRTLRRATRLASMIVGYIGVGSCCCDRSMGFVSLMSVFEVARGRELRWTGLSANCRDVPILPDAITDLQVRRVSQTSSIASLMLRTLRYPGDPTVI